MTKISKNGEEHESITLRVPIGTKERLEHYAELDWINMSDIVRRGIKQQLEILSEKYDSPNVIDPFSERSRNV